MTRRDTRTSRYIKESVRNAVLNHPETFYGIAHPVVNDKGQNVTVNVERPSIYSGTTANHYLEVACNPLILKSLGEGQGVLCGFKNRLDRTSIFIISIGFPHTSADDAPLPALADVWFYLHGNITGVGSCGGSVKLLLNQIPPNRLGGPSGAGGKVLELRANTLGVVYVSQDNVTPEQLHLLSYTGLDTVLFTFDTLQTTAPQEVSGNTDTAFLAGVEKLCVQDLSLDTSYAYVTLLDKDNQPWVFTVDLGAVKPTAAHRNGTSAFHMKGEALAITPYESAPVIPPGLHPFDTVICQLGELGGNLYVDISDQTGKTVDTPLAGYDPNVNLREFGLQEWMEGMPNFYGAFHPNALHPTTWTPPLGWGGVPGRDGEPSPNDIAAEQGHNGLIYSQTANLLVPTIKGRANDLTTVNPIASPAASVVLRGGWRDQDVWTHLRILCTIGSDVLVWFNEFTGAIQQYHGPTIPGTPGNGPALATYNAAITVAAGHCAPGGVIGDHGAQVSTEATTALSAIPDYPTEAWVPASNRCGLRRYNLQSKAVVAEYQYPVDNIAISGRKAGFISGGVGLSAPSYRTIFGSAVITAGQTVTAQSKLGNGSDDVIWRGWTVVQTDVTSTGGSLGTTIVTSITPTFTAPTNRTLHIWWGALMGTEPNVNITWCPTDLAKHGLMVAVNPSRTRLVQFPQVQTGAWVFGSPYTGAGARGDITVLGQSDPSFFIDGFGDLILAASPCDPHTGIYSPPTLLLFDISSTKTDPGKIAFMREIPIPDPGTPQTVFHPGELHDLPEVRYGLPAWRGDDILYWIRRMNIGGTWLGTLNTFNHKTNALTHVDMWTGSQKESIPFNVKSAHAAIEVEDGLGNIFHIE